MDLRDDFTFGINERMVSGQLEVFPFARSGASLPGIKVDPRIFRFGLRCFGGIPFQYLHLHLGAFFPRVGHFGEVQRMVQKSKD